MVQVFEIAGVQFTWCAWQGVAVSVLEEGPWMQARLVMPANGGQGQRGVASCAAGRSVLGDWWCWWRELKVWMG